MSELKAVLHDGSEIGIEEFALPIHLTVICATREELMDLWDRLSTENLSELSIRKNGEVQQMFANVTLDGVQTIINADATLTVHFYMHGEGATDNEYIQAARILLGEEV